MRRLGGTPGKRRGSRRSASCWKPPCATGFLSRTLCSALGRTSSIAAVDINLTPQQIQRLEESFPAARYMTRLPPKGNRYDLVLLLDVVEHIQDDLRFLEDLVRDHAKVGARVLVTVPAFPALYCDHDRFLGHHRRYRLDGIERLLKRAGLQVLSSGYLFGSLLLPKLLLFKLLSWRKSTDGIGCWQGGTLATAFIRTLLHLDNSLLIMAAKIGVKIPGLTAWVLCDKPLPPCLN